MSITKRAFQLHSYQMDKSNGDAFVRVATTTNLVDQPVFTTWGGSTAKMQWSRLRKHYQKVINAPTEMVFEHIC